MNSKKIFSTNPPLLVSKQLNFTGSITDEVSLAFENEVTICDSIKQNLRAKGVPIIGGPRFDKIEQALILERFKINHPQTFFTKSFECIKTIDELNSYVDLEEFVVKPLRGARGIGVKKITRKEFKDCLTNKNNVSEVFKEEKQFLSKSNYEDVSFDYIESSISYMLIQEPIEVKQEFRLILFQPDTFLIYERVKKDETQFCGNLSHGTIPKPVSEEIVKRYIYPVKQKFYEIMNEFKYPYLSIDIYVDKNENVGCFEFQMEFAYEGFNFKDVRNKMENSIKFYL